MMTELNTSSLDSNEQHLESIPTTTNDTHASSSSSSSSSQVSLSEALAMYEPGLQVNLEHMHSSSELFSCARIVPPTSALRRRIIAITRNGAILELAPHPTKLGFGKILETHHVTALSHVKFNRGSAAVVSVSFHSGLTLNYQLVDPAPFVDALQLVLSSFGLRGERKRGAADAKHIKTAEDFLVLTKEIAACFSLNPHIKHIEKIMDLLREATEQFSMADDDRYLTVLSQIQNFLRRQDVIGVLDAGMGAASNSTTTKRKDTAPQHPPTPPHPSSSSSAFPSSSSMTNLDAECGDDREVMKVPTSSIGVRMAMGSLLGEIDFAAGVEKEKRQQPRILLSRAQEYDEDNDEEFTIGSLSPLHGQSTMAGDLHAMVEDMSGQFSSLMDTFATSHDSSSSIRNEHIS